MNQANTQSNTIANANSQKLSFLAELGIQDVNAGACTGSGAWSDIKGRDMLDSVNPATGEVIARVAQASIEDYQQVMAVAG